MPQRNQPPVGTKHEEAAHVLQTAGEEDIEIVRQADKVVIEIRTASPAAPAGRPGTWAQAAAELSRAAPLTGLGAEFRRQARRFRKSIALRSPF